MAYIYIHKKKTTGEIFYVGKGSGKRYTSTHSRNVHWHNTVKKYGYTIEILIKNLGEDEAYEKEIELIREYTVQGVKLVNQTLGGKGRHQSSELMQEFPELYPDEYQTIEALRNALPQWWKDGCKPTEKYIAEPILKPERKSVLKTKKNTTIDNECREVIEWNGGYVHLLPQAWIIKDARVLNI